jgi:predicted HicB family RNase H-like nuclease
MQWRELLEVRQDRRRVAEPEGAALHREVAQAVAGRTVLSNDAILSTCLTLAASPRPAMSKRMTITLDESLYEGLHLAAGKRGASRLIQDLLRQHLAAGGTLDEGYRAMAADTERETDAQVWCQALAQDMADEAR